MGSLNDLLGKSVYLDANIFIYFLEEYPKLGDLAARVFAEIDAARIRGATSELTLAELLVKPIRDSNARAVAQYDQIIRPRSAFDVVPISRPILLEAAHVRASTQLKFPDAIHAATASLAGCQIFLTNDERIHVGGLTKILLAELSA